MTNVREIERFFSPDRILLLCEDEFTPLAEQIAFNIQTKRTNSGAEVNALGVPEETTGATAESLRTISEMGADGLVVSFVGRHNIKNIDEGSSPADIHEEFGSFESFLRSIETWAAAKEARWMLEPGQIDPYGVASSLWSHGSVLYQEGGGTEIMKYLLEPAVENINREFTEMLDETIYNLIDESIDI